MKKSQKIIIACIFLLFASGCRDPFKYYESNPELQVVASHSLLVKGYHDDQVIMIEEDGYGRVLFLYITGYLFDRVVSLVVSQKTTDTEAYFYDGINFIMAKEDTHKNISSAGIESIDITFPMEKLNSLIGAYFTEEQLETLKATNDWNKPIDESKLFKIKRVEKKKRSVSVKLLEKAFETVSPYFHQTFTTYLCSDKYGQSVYLMIGQRYDDQLKTYVDDQAFLFMFDKSGNLVGPNAIEPIDDLWHYQQQLYNFKLKNGWAFYQ